MSRTHLLRLFVALGIVFLALLPATPGSAAMGYTAGFSRAGGTAAGMDREMPPALALADTCTSVSLEAVADTYLNQDSTSSNYGDSSRVEVRGSDDGDAYHPLLLWDLSGIPGDATVTDASITLRVTDTTSDDYYLYAMRRAWEEGDGSAGSGADWNDYNAAGNDWGTAGARSTTTDRYDTNLWDVDVLASDGEQTSQLNADGIAVVQGWVNGSLLNYGVTIQNYAQDGTADFASRENTSYDGARLNVSYCVSPATGTIIVEKQTDPGGWTGKDFQFTGAVTGSIADDEQIQVSGLEPGEYHVQEVVPAGWTLTQVTCDDANSVGDLPNREADIQLEAGEVVRCTFYNLLQLDLGDAPDSYKTRLAVDGARHAIVAGHSLGPAVDSEPDGQPSTLADGDDLLSGDDEDGVTFPGPLVAGSQATARVDGGPAGGELDAWIDFNRNGLFDHVTEHLWGGTSRTLGLGGPQDLTFAVPADAVVGGGTSVLNLEYSALVAANTGTDLLPILTANDAQVAVGGAVGSSVVSTVTPSNAEPAAGEQIVVSIDMDMTGVAAPDDALGSLAGSLSWNPAVLDYVSDSGLLAGFSSDITVDEVAGRITFEGSHPTGVPGSGTALTVTFDVLATGTSPLDLEYSALVAANTGTDLLPILTANDAQVAAGGAVASSVVSTVTPSNAEPAAGEQIVVSIEMDMTGAVAPDDALGSLAGSLSWNPAVLDYVSDSGLLAGFSSDITVDEVAGQMTFAGSHPTGVPGSGIALTITFDVVGVGPTYARFRLSTAGGLAPSGFAADGEVEDYQVEIRAQTFTLDYTAGTGGSLTGQTHQVVSYGGDGTAVTAVPGTGYEFVDWSDGSTANPRTDANVMANVDVTANFALLTFTLDYAGGDNGTLAGETHQVVAYGGSGTPVTAVPNTGYDFVHWSDDSTANPRTDSNITGNVNVTAIFGRIWFSLDYAAGPGGTLTGETYQVIEYGTSGTAVTAVPGTGYEFVDWSDGSTANPRTDANVMANVDVTANFAPTCYALTPGHTGSGTTPVAAPSGSAGCEAGYYHYGEIITLSEATPDPGWGIASWYGTDADSSTAGTNSVTMPAGTRSAGVNYLRLLGDVNVDGLVDSTDALIILTVDAGLPAGAFCPLNYGDVNLDGWVNSTDALIILTYNVGLPVPFAPGQPVTEPVLIVQPPGCSS